MALKATIFKAELQVADMDRHHYADYSLTLARHPSETDERMMVRLAAFALNASERLAFGKGLSTEDEPDLVAKDLTGAIGLWIDVGLPDSRDVRKACGRAAAVRVYTYGRGAGLWWEQNRDALERCDNLAVFDLPAGATQALAALAERTMRLQCTIQDGHLWLTDGERTAEVVPAAVKAPAGR